MNKLERKLRDDVMYAHKWIENAEKDYKEAVELLNEFLRLQKKKC